LIVRNVPLTLTELTRSQSSVLISHIGGCELSSVIPAFATRILGGPKVLLADSNAAAMEASDVRSPLTQCSLRFCSGVVARMARSIARRSRAVTRQPWPAKVMSQNAACALQRQGLCAVHALRNSCTAAPPIPPALPSVVLFDLRWGIGVAPAAPVTKTCRPSRPRKDESSRGAVDISGV
jgi:hypothetical protein